MISEEMLKSALAEYEQAQSAQLPEPEIHQFSPGFARKMKACTQRAAYGKGWLYARRAACIALVFLLFGSCLMAVPQVRAAVASWFIYRDPDGGAMYLPNSSTAAQAGNYGISWVPEGFLPDERHGLKQTVRYLTADRNMILLEWKSPKDGGMGLGGWADKTYTTTVNGRPADVYLYTEALEQCILVWISEDESVLFILTTNCDEETTIRIAESIYQISP